MENEIIKQLGLVSSNYNVKILQACESGSRAWGFASPDSDFDVRFIYKNKPEWYLNLWEQCDFIQFMTKDDLDGSGWDLAKAIKLLAKSNIPLLEWINSPIQYIYNESFIKKMKSFAEVCFSPISAIHHYIGTTKNFIETTDKEEVKLKSLFYALRTALAGKWIIEFQTMPPVLLTEMLILTDKAMETRINELIQYKKTKDESYFYPKDEMINTFILETINFNEMYAKTLSPGKNINKELNEFFIEEIHRL